jgi:hypothetical protein
VIRLDSLDVTLDMGPLPAIAYDRLRGSETVDPSTGEVEAAWTARPAETGLHGFNGLRATETSVSFWLSAKAMGDRYTSGISNRTIDELADRLTATGLVTVTADQLRAGRVRRADPFADVRSDDLDGFAASLRLLGRTSGDATWTKGRGDSVSLYTMLPGKLGKLRTYGKERELGLAKHRDFCTLYPEAAASIGGCHRAEVEMKSRKAFRRSANMAEGVVTLADVLDSPRTPVSDALDAFLDTWAGRRRALNTLTTAPPSLDAFLSMPTANANADAFGLLATLIADLCAGDLDACKAAVRARYGAKNAGRHYPALQAACEAYRAETAAETPHAFAHDTFAEYVGRVREREQTDGL